MAMRNIVKLGDPMLKKHSRTVESLMTVWRSSLTI